MLNIALTDPRSSAAAAHQELTRMKLGIDEARRVIAILVHQRGGHVVITDNELSHVPREPFLDVTPGAPGTAHIRTPCWDLGDTPPV